MIELEGGEIMITNQNTSKLFFSQVSDNASLNLKAKASQVKSDSEFKSVFDKTLNNTVNSSVKRPNNIDVAKNNNDISQDSDSKIKYKSFREVQLANKVGTNQNSVEKSAGDSKLQKVDLEEQKATKSSKDKDEPMNVMAQMLGLQPNELIKLANELGFNSEDLKDIKKLALFMDKLSTVLELNDSQKALVAALVKEVSKQVKTEDVSNEVETPESSPDIQNEVKASITNKTIDLAKVSETVKAKLDHLLQKASKDPELIGAEISKVIEAMRAQIHGKVPAIQVEAKTISDEPTADITTDSNLDQLPVNGNVTNTKDSAKASDYKEETSEDTNSSNTNTEADTKNVSTQVVVSKDQNQINQQSEQAFGHIKADAINNQTEVQKPSFSMPQPIKSSEVINQVIEHAKVIVGQDKSEMIIHLKPDHLGKLELKVVTEQGIVAAKFIAESQQVKEVIETNMQLLKDSLQKQGISINAISVQVGNDKQSEYQQNNSFQSKNSGQSNKFKQGSNGLGISKAGINAFDILPERLAQYAYESNTINLTA